MIVTKPPIIIERFKFIRAIVAIDVRDPCDFGLLSYQKRSVAVSHPKHFVQPTGEFMKLWLGMLIKRSIGQKDVTASSPNGQTLFVGHHFKATRFNRQFFWQWNVDQFVVLGFLFRRSPILAQRLLLQEHRRGKDRKDF